MSEVSSPQPASKPMPRMRRDWDGVAAIIAAFVGLLALCVSGYTAYIQREQVRAQVWPYLIMTNYDNERSLSVLNKGVGPAIVRSARVRVDGNPQPDWDHVLDALGIEKPHPYSLSTISVNVLSPGEHTEVLSFGDAAVYNAFRTAAAARMRTELCYCSTLGECWVYQDNFFGTAPSVEPSARCPEIPRGQEFHN